MATLKKIFFDMILVCNHYHYNNLISGIITIITKSNFYSILIIYN